MTLEHVPNSYFVSGSGSPEDPRVAILSPLALRPMSKDGVMNLAAWLLTVGFVEPEEFAEVWKAVRES